MLGILGEGLHSAHFFSSYPTYIYAFSFYFPQILKHVPLHILVEFQMCGL